MSYSDKAFEIIKQSISSAIFIDEKAKEFYSQTPIDEQIIEEKLSVELHNNFKTEGISLAVHKFKVADVDNADLKKYLLKDRDLVLLDWELDGVDGTIYSLRLLSEVVNYSHINFCCIYTSTTNFDAILHHISSYFSGLCEDDYIAISNQYDFINVEEFLPLAKEICISGDEVALDGLIEDSGVILGDFPIESDLITSKFDKIRSIVKSFEKYHKSAQREVSLSSVSDELSSFVINNTFVFILTKEAENDVKPTVLIKRISNELIRNKNSFIQLLGLEMQTIFNDNESFIDENLLNTSSEAFFTHRNHLKIKNGSDVPFNTLIKKVLVEHATLRLRTAKLSLLTEDFLDSVSHDYLDTPTNEEVASMNTFYNSVSIKSLNDIDLPNINFGDVFFDTEGKKDYFLCITALCDCLRPEKIKQNYFFVVGQEISIETANILGDTAFISYVSSKTAISWIKLESANPLKANNKGASPEQSRINNLEAKVKALEQFKFKPVYIQPHIYNVQEPKITDEAIKIRRIESLVSVGNPNDNGDINFKTIHYVTTLRPNYAQRIANHAFTHPVRVGVDFVKI